MQVYEDFNVPLIGDGGFIIQEFKLDTMFCTWLVAVSIK